MDIGTLPGGTFSRANAINNLGQVVGDAETTPSYIGLFHAFLYINGTMTDLGTQPGVTVSFANAINDQGQVVGESCCAGGDRHAFIYSNGSMTDLGTLGGSASEAVGINDSGQVVGRASNAFGDQRAFLYTNRVMIDVNSLIDPSLNITLWSAPAINNAGQILAFANPGGKLAAAPTKPTALTG